MRVVSTPQFGLARLPYCVEAMCKFMCDLLEYGKQLAESQALNQYPVLRGKAYVQKYQDPV